MFAKSCPRRTRSAIFTRRLPAEVEHDGISRDCVGCYRHGGVKSLVVSRHIVRKTIPGEHYRTIGHRHDRFTIGMVGTLLARISGKCRAVVDPLPIDREAPGNLRLAIKD